MHTKSHDQDREMIKDRKMEANMSKDILFRGSAFTPRCSTLPRLNACSGQ